MKEKGEAEDEMVRQHHRLNGPEFEQTLGDGEGQESLACCNPWGRKESDTTEQLSKQQTMGVEQPLIQPWGALVVCQAQSFLRNTSSVLLTDVGADSIFILILQKKATEAQRS